MRFTGDKVDIEPGLIDALEADNLVIFVGAGVSARAFPNQRKGTYYPDFRRLVKGVGVQADRPITAEEEELLMRGAADRVLGEWATDKVPVHAIASKILTENAENQRLDLHRAIVRLFPEGSTPRIVTTNFDRLLLRALDEERKYSAKTLDWWIYTAPLLPPAPRFSGLCFLHGSVEESDEMVLTDKDIGRAYMDEGWALRFAHTLFNHFDVLFIGYSLEDPPLRYLSLALAGTTTRKRWALVGQPETEIRQREVVLDWRRRGAEPIWFPAKRKDYRAIERTLDAWGKDRQQSFLDMTNLLIEFGRSEPSELEPHNLDRARRFLKDQDVARDFALSTPKPAWFNVLIDDGHLSRIFSRDSALQEVDYACANLLVEWLLNDPDLWIVKLAEYRTKLNPILLSTFSRRVRNNSSREIPVQVVDKVCELFHDHLTCPRQGMLLLELKPLLERLVQEGHPVEAVDMFMRAIQPVVHYTRKLSLDYFIAEANGEDTSDIEQYATCVELRHPSDQFDYHAKEILEDVFLANSVKVGHALVQAAAHQIVHFGRRDPFVRKSGDTTMHVRSAIEPHPEDQYRTNPLSFLVDVARSSWQKLYMTAPDVAIQIRKLWEVSDDPLLKRLSLHAMTYIVEYDDGTRC